MVGAARAVACSGIAARHQQFWDQRDCVLPPVRQQRQPSSRRLAGAPVISAAATDGSTTASRTFEQLYAGLAGVLAPGGVVAARPTPLGRGLVAEQPAAQGDVLLSGKLTVRELVAFVTALLSRAGPAAAFAAAGDDPCMPPRRRSHPHLPPCHPSIPSCTVQLTGATCCA